MIRSAASKVMWVGRTTAAVVGLAIALALVLGVATMALAAVPGDPLKLGKVNRINDALTTLIGSRSGAMMAIDNGSTATNARALDLRVEPGRAPMAVNSGKKVKNLNADKLDGTDSAGFLSSEIYTMELIKTTPANTEHAAGISCDAGDPAISGGFLQVDSTTHVSRSARNSQNTWGVTVLILAGSTSDTWSIQAVCADLPPLRP